MCSIAHYPSSYAVSRILHLQDRLGAHPDQSCEGVGNYGQKDRLIRQLQQKEKYLTVSLALTPQKGGQTPPEYRFRMLLPKKEGVF